MKDNKEVSVETLKKQLALAVKALQFFSQPNGEITIGKGTYQVTLFPKPELAKGVLQEIEGMGKPDESGEIKTGSKDSFFNVQEGATYRDPNVNTQKTSFVTWK